MKHRKGSKKKTIDPKLRQRAKARLWSEVGHEMPTLALGSAAMVVSMYCNQGM